MGTPMAPNPANPTRNMRGIIRRGRHKGKRRPRGRRHSRSTGVLALRAADVLDGAVGVDAGLGELGPAQVLTLAVLLTIHAHRLDRFRVPLARRLATLGTGLGEIFRDIRRDTLIVLSLGDALIARGQLIVRS